jgi:hypothetical protein
MKKLVLILILTFIGNYLFSQTVYSCQYKSDADIKVYVSKYKSDADLVVYKCKYKSDATGNQGLWYFTNYKSDAGWQKKDKQHLMY